MGPHMQKHIFNYCLSPPKLSLLPSLCIIPRSLGMRDREDKDHSAHSADEDTDPESHRVPRKLDPKFPSWALSPLSHCPCLPEPITWCREVSGVSCRVTGSRGQPPAKMSWRHRWGWRKDYGALGQPLPPPGCPSQSTLPRGVPLTPLLTTPHPDTPHEYSPGVQKPRKVAQPGVPAPSGPFPPCPPGSETLHKWRGREPH